MKQTTQFVIFGAIALLIVIGVFLFYKSQPRYNWYETYELKSKEPYGAYVAGELLKRYFPKKAFKVLNKPVSEILKEDKSHEKQNYIFLGSDIPFDSSEASSLFSLAEKGNTVFISSSYTSSNFFYSIFSDTCAQQEDYSYIRTLQDSTIGVNFFNPALKEEKDFTETYLFRNRAYTYSWSYIDSFYFCGQNSSTIALGYISPGKINFVKKHYGKGDIYIHTTPLMFSNNSLLQKENVEYASRVFSYLPEGNIIWNEYNNIPGDVTFNSDLRLSQSPLQYILSQESLKWAWYITLLLVLLYSLFYGKRRQRIIPIIEGHTNTSLEFIQTIGQLYFQQKNHKVLCMHKMKLFKNFIRQRYSINTNETNEEVFKNISLKSQIPFEDVKAIFYYFEWIEKNNTLSDEEFIEFHNLMEKFYKHCK